MASANLPSGSNMPGLGNHQKGNLRIDFEEGKVRNCDKCKHSIKDILCFCKKCGNYLHLKCAGVGYRHDGNQVMLPMPEQLPKSCQECLIINLRRMPINQSLQDHQESRSRMVTNQNAATNLPLQIATMISNRLNDHHRRSINGSCNSIRIPKRARTDLSRNDHQERFTVGRNNTIRFLNQSAHNPGHELQKKHCGTVYKCFRCKEKGFGSHYVCQNTSGSFRVHEFCMSPPKKLVHQFFPKLRFAFHYSPKIKHCNQCKTGHSTISCNACGMDVNGYFYESNDGKKHLHPCCANLPHQIICGESGITMDLKPNTTSKCSYCHEATMMVGNKKTDMIWSYVSQCRYIHLHVPCMIKMLSDFKVIDSKSNRANGSTSLLTLHKKTEVNSMTKLEFQIAAADVKKKWERKFKTTMKYAKIVLGAIISACLGHPTPFNLNCIVAFTS